ELPPLDLAAHNRLAALVADLVEAVVATPAGSPGLVAGVHDVAEGGLGVALAEMAVRSGVGLVAHGVATHAALFSEAPSRVVVCTRDPEALGLAADAAGVPWSVLGRAGGDRLVVGDLVDLSLAEVTAAWRGAIPGALRATEAGPGSR
ncbi:MAG TPA: AIR synthase-related protein, partial [Acidimicrobiales bacterium]|nr:AIR synthase-related protein [Acidimicrobiales bacterium]